MQTFEKSQNFHYSQVGLVFGCVFIRKSIDIFLIQMWFAVPGFASHPGYIMIECFLWFV